MIIYNKNEEDVTMKKKEYWKAAVISAMIAAAALSGCSGKNTQAESKEEKSNEAEFNYTGAAPVTNTPDADIKQLICDTFIFKLYPCAFLIHLFLLTIPMFLSVFC